MFLNKFSILNIKTGEIFKSELTNLQHQDTSNSTVLPNGVQLFDQLSSLEVIQNTNTDREILQEHAEQLADRVCDDSIIIELSPRSVTKTQLILQSMENRKKRIKYYALDSVQNVLIRLLSSLNGKLKYVQIMGLVGKYEESMSWLNQAFTNKTSKVVIWLENLIVCDRPNWESIIFLRLFKTTCMHHGYFCVIGVDHRNRKAVDSNDIVDHEFFSKDDSMRGDSDVIEILNAVGLNIVHLWSDAHKLYSLVLSEFRQFHFQQNLLATLYEKEHNDTCDANTISLNHKLVNQCSRSHDQCNLSNFTSKHWPSTLPALHEWEALWSSWDVVTRSILNHETMLFEKPIAQRHPFIFYLGHIPTFVEVMLTRHRADHELSSILTEPLTGSSIFADIFERGIDPDLDDPSQCNPHSEVPEQDSVWPSVDSILEYQQAVRSRLKRLLLHWETVAEDSIKWMTTSRQRSARVVWMCFEHEAMHLETILYMLVQSPNSKCPPVSAPLWYLHQQCNDRDDDAMLSILPNASWIRFNEATVEIGHDDSEDLGIQTIPKDTMGEFGWDNEHPKRMSLVLPFEIQSRPVTNGEYWIFWKEHSDQEVLWPASWGADNICNCDVLPKVKTIFGLCAFPTAVNWPVQVSCEQAELYAASITNNMRLPTEAEFVHFRRKMDNKLAKNIGFASWTPLPLNNEQTHIVGDVWEWTSTVWDYHEGFTPSQLYPGYSADFFDKKHRVVLGGSWATHPRIAERASFRNWYQRRYPYVFSGFRLCRLL